MVHYENDLDPPIQGLLRYYCDYVVPGSGADNIGVSDENLAGSHPHR